MGEMTVTTKMIFGLVVYFLLLTLIMTIATAISQEFDLDNDISSSGGYDSQTGLGEIDSDSSFGTIWDAVKIIATLQIDFGIQDDFLNFTLNFFLVLLPFILLVIAVAILVREFVGAT